MTTPKINPAFQNIIPPLTAEEQAGLEAAIMEDGCRDALVVWRGWLLDGHHRLAICQKHNLPFKTVEWELPDEAAAMDWIDANQLARRNLTPDQASIIRGRRYNRIKLPAAGRTGRNFSELQSDTPKDTAAEIATKCGVSRATVIRDEVKKLEADGREADTSG